MVRVRRRNSKGEGWKAPEPAPVTMAVLPLTEKAVGEDMVSVFQS